MISLNKPELIKEVAKKAGVNKAIATSCITALVEVVEETLMYGDKVQIIGFGTFTPVNRAARQGVNPQTGEAMLVPERKVPTFKPSQNFKDLLN